MKSTLIKGGVTVALASVVWAFVGVERIVGDHEVGVSWEPFVKHRPSLQVRFVNPAQRGLEIVPFEDLSPSERAALSEFCGIRFGVTNVTQCYVLISERKI